MSAWMDMARDAGYRGDEQRAYAEMIEYEAWLDWQRKLEADEQDDYWGEDE